jgi:hypothetical protein
MGAPDHGNAHADGSWGEAIRRAGGDAEGPGRSSFVFVATTA